jgi:hypothetical protein
MYSECERDARVRWDARSELLDDLRVAVPAGQLANALNVALHVECRV